MNRFFEVSTPSITNQLFRACFTTCIALIISPVASAQLVEGDVVFGEFFEELHQVDTNSGAVVDILDSPLGESVFVMNTEILDPNSVLISDFSDLVRYDVPSQTTSLLTTLSFNPQEITRDINGNLIATSTSGVFRVDGTTGAETLIHDDTFFSAGDAVVDQSGNIFVTEFFDALGVVGSNGFTQIGNFSANQFSNIDIGTDGQLYLASTFGGEFWRVNPVTGQGTQLGSDLFSSLDDIQVDANGDILFSATVNSIDGLHLFDPNSATITNVFDSDDFNGGFFSPGDLDIFESSLRSTNFVSVPEPTSATSIGLVLIGISMKRRRK